MSHLENSEVETRDKYNTLLFLKKVVTVNTTKETNYNNPGQEYVYVNRTNRKSTQDLLLQCVLTLQLDPQRSLRSNAATQQRISQHNGAAPSKDAHGRELCQSSRTGTLD